MLSEQLMYLMFHTNVTGVNPQRTSNRTLVNTREPSLSRTDLNAIRLSLLRLDLLDKSCVPFGKLISITEISFPETVFVCVLSSE
jgi:hypothetical protein